LKLQPQIADLLNTIKGVDNIRCNIGTQQVHFRSTASVPSFMYYLS